MPILLGHPISLLATIIFLAMLSPTQQMPILILLQMETTGI